MKTTTKVGIVCLILIVSVIAGLVVKDYNVWFVVCFILFGVLIIADFAVSEIKDYIYEIKNYIKEK